VKRKILSTVLVSTLMLLSTNSFAEIPTCNNTDMKDAIKSVEQSISRKTIQLRFNENDIKDMAELNADAQRVNTASVALLGFSVAAALTAFEAAGTVAAAAVRYSVTAMTPAQTAVLMTYFGSLSGFLSVMVSSPFRSDRLTDTIADDTVKAASNSLASKQKNLKERSLRYGFELKQSTDDFLSDFIDGNDRQLDERTEKLLATHRDAGNGLLGGKGARYTAALLAVVEARKKLYTFQVDTLQKLKVNIARSCSELESGKL
jgi:hypothetical protein